MKADLVVEDKGTATVGAVTGSVTANGGTVTAESITGGLTMDGGKVTIQKDFEGTITLEELDSGTAELKIEGTVKTEEAIAVPEGYTETLGNVTAVADGKNTVTITVDGHLEAKSISGVDETKINSANTLKVTGDLTTGTLVLGEGKNAEGKTVAVAGKAFTVSEGKMVIAGGDVKPEEPELKVVKSEALGALWSAMGEDKAEDALTGAMNDVNVVFAGKTITVTGTVGYIGNMNRFNTAKPEENKGHYLAIDVIAPVDVAAAGGRP